MGAHVGWSTVSTSSLRDFLEGQWGPILAGEAVCAPLGDIEDPAERFEWFTECGGLGAVRRYAMPLRDGSRIRADVDEAARTVRFSRDRFDPSRSVGSALRYALYDSKVARAAAVCVSVFRAGR